MNSDNKIENGKKIRKRLLNASNERVYEYYNNLLTKDLPKKHKSNVKITDNDFVIPDIHEYELIIENSYSIDNIKKICRFYKQKLSGNKSQLIVRIYNFLKLTNAIIKIQKIWRGYLQRVFDIYHGPGYFKRCMCVNDTDFYTLDKLINIPTEQFFSFKDEQGFIYGFDIMSIYNLFIINGSKSVNPYNKNILDSNVFTNIKMFLKFSKILKFPTKINIEESDDTLGNNINMRILSVFQNMDSLGNYTDTRWFSELTCSKIVIFIRELYDIWMYRAQIDQNLKRDICPPHGDPFRHTNFGSLNGYSITNIKKNALSIIEKLVLTGTNIDNKTLGTYYVLSSLTLVSDDAAEAMPWLYQSVAVNL